MHVGSEAPDVAARAWLELSESAGLAADDQLRAHQPQEALREVSDISIRGAATAVCLMGTKSYLPALKDRNGNRYIGVMGQFDEYQAAYEKKLADSIFYMPFGLTPDGIVEYDAETGLPNAKCELTINGIRCDAAVISGPMFDEANAA
jgi:hypothetical protein